MRVERLTPDLLDDWLAYFDRDAFALAIADLLLLGKVRGAGIGRGIGGHVRFWNGCDLSGKKRGVLLW